MENQGNVLIKVTKVAGGKIFEGNGSAVEILSGVAVVAESLMGALERKLGMDKKTAAEAILFSAKLGIESYLSKNAGGT